MCYDVTSCITLYHMNVWFGLLNDRKSSGIKSDVAAVELFHRYNM